MIFAAANGWDVLNTLVDRAPGIFTAALLIWQVPKVKAIDNAVNGRKAGDATMSAESKVVAAESKTSRLRDEAQDAAAADVHADAAEGSADRAAGATTDDD